jgi:hypothetical protein
VRLYSWAVIGFSVLFLGLGAAILVRTALEGGGVAGFLLGGLFVVLGAARLTLERRRRGS